MNADHPSATHHDHREAVICACLHRTASEIQEAAARLGLETFEDVATAVLAGAGCTSCRQEVETILETVPATESARKRRVSSAGLREVREDEAESPAERVGDEQAATSAGGRKNP